MFRRWVIIVGLAIASLSSLGCTPPSNFIEQSARISIGDFFGDIVSEGVDRALGL